MVILLDGLHLTTEVLLSDLVRRLINFYHLRFCEFLLLNGVWSRLAQTALHFNRFCYFL
jgi:hypothetical protein